MDRTLAEIIRTFNHIVRDFFIYFVSGAVVSINILIIDYFYYEQSLYKAINSNFLIFIYLITCYVIGHICMAFYYLLLELTGFDKTVKECKNICNEEKEEKEEKEINKEEDIEKSLPELYKQDPQIYIQFIERYDNLTLMRWNLSSSFFINFITTFIYTSFIQSYWQIYLLKCLFLIFSIIMYLLYLKTEKDYIKRIGSVKKMRSTDTQN